MCFPTCCTHLLHFWMEKLTNQEWNAVCFWLSHRKWMKNHRVSHQNALWELFMMLTMMCDGVYLWFSTFQFPTTHFSKVIKDYTTWHHWKLFFNDIAQSQLHMADKWATKLAYIVLFKTCFTRGRQISTCTVEHRLKNRAKSGLNLCFVTLAIKISTIQ